MKYAELSAYLVAAPLYRPKQLEVTFGLPIVERPGGEGLPMRNPKELPVPEEVERYCPGTKCRKTTHWRWAGVPGSAERFGVGLKSIPYTCRNCGEQSFTVWIHVWLKDGVLFVEKVGQHPKLQIALPPDFEKALGESKDLYIRGMATRHAGYGIGALGYFRRLIDETIADMLGVLEAAMVETGVDPAAIETVQRARAGKVFDERVKLAAEAIPPNLKPGGMNPFADLYDLHSIGLHGLSDEECCDIVDAMDEAMKYVYTELKGRTEGAARYKEAATKIHQTVAKLSAQKQGQAGT